MEDKFKSGELTKSQIKEVLNPFSLAGELFYFAEKNLGEM